MTTSPRVVSAVMGRPANFETALAHQPKLASKFGELYGLFWRNGLVSERVKEIARMRNARTTGCGYCRNVRFDGARREGLTEKVISDITDDYESSSSFSSTEKSALRLTDAIITDPKAKNETLRAELLAHFSREQLVELTLGVVLFVVHSKALITMGLEPENMAVTLAPTPSRGRYSGDSEVEKGFTLDTTELGGR